MTVMTDEFGQAEKAKKMRLTLGDGSGTPYSTHTTCHEDISNHLKSCCVNNLDSHRLWIVAEKPSGQVIWSKNICWKTSLLKQSSGCQMLAHSLLSFEMKGSNMFKPFRWVNSCIFSTLKHMCQYGKLSRKHLDHWPHSCEVVTVHPMVHQHVLHVSMAISEVPRNLRQPHV